MDLHGIVGSLNRIENYCVKYIYKKYIEEEEQVLEEEKLQEVLEGECREEEEINSSGNENGNGSESEFEIEDTPEHKIRIYKYKYNKRPLNRTKYKKYLKTILNVERKAIITQKESLSEDLKNMSIADEEYEKDPNNFKITDYESYPDENRCCYIRSHKNKLIRCKNKIGKDEANLCNLHKDNINMFWNRYQYLVRKMEC